VRHAILIATLVVAGGCAGQSVSSAPTPASGNTGRASTPGNQVGASSSRAAIEGFLAAVKVADLQGMSALWGNERGPARDKFSREELEKRLVIMQCSLQHDRWNFIDDAPRPQTGGRHAWSVNFNRKRVTAKGTMITVQGPGGRWFLEDVPDIGGLKALCT
jgi:hypothetical protein